MIQSMYVWIYVESKEYTCFFTKGDSLWWTFKDKDRKALKGVLHVKVLRMNALVLISDFVSEIKIKGH